MRQHHCHSVHEGSEVHKKTKHIDRCYHFMRNAIKTEEVFIKSTSTNKMIVDLLTKLIPTDVFKAHALNLGLRRV